MRFKVFHGVPAGSIWVLGSVTDLQGSFRGFQGVSSDFRAVGEVFKRFSGEPRIGLRKKLQEFQGVSRGFRDILERLHRHSGELQGYFRRGSEEFLGVLEGFTSFQEVFIGFQGFRRLPEGEGSSGPCTIVPAVPESDYLHSREFLVNLNSPLDCTKLHEVVTEAHPLSCNRALIGL